MPDRSFYRSYSEKTQSVFVLFDQQLIIHEIFGQIASVSFCLEPNPIQKELSNVFAMDFFDKIRQLVHQLGEHDYPIKFDYKPKQLASNPYEIMLFKADSTGKQALSIRSKVAKKEQNQIIQQMISFIDAMYAPICLSDLATGQVVFMNKLAVDLFEKPANKEFSELSTKSLFPVPGDRDLLVERMEQEVKFETEANMQTFQKKKFRASVSAHKVVYFDQTFSLCMFRDLSSQVKLEVALELKTKHLEERVKEMTALQKVFHLTNSLDNDLNEIGTQIPFIVREAMQYENDALVELQIGYSKFQLDDFIESPWMISASSKTDEGMPIHLEVAYTSEHPQQDIGPFFEEEKRTLESIVRILTNYINQKTTIQVNQEEMELIERVVDESTNSIVILDAETGEFVHFNQSAYTLLGYTAEEFRYLKVADIQKTMSESQIRDISEAVKEGKPITFESTHTRKDGSNQSVILSLSPLLFRRKPHLLVQWQDITREKQEQADNDFLHARTRLYTELLTTLSVHPDALNGNIQGFSSYLVKLLGESLIPEEIIIITQENDQDPILAAAYNKTTNTLRYDQSVNANSYRAVVDEIQLHHHMDIYEVHPNHPVQTLFDHKDPIKSIVGTTIFINGQVLGLLLFVTYHSYLDLLNIDQNRKQRITLSFIDNAATQIGVVILNHQRKLIFNALERSEKFLKRAQGVANIGHWYFDLVANRLEWSEQTYEIFEVAKETFIDLNRFVSYIHPEDQENVINEWTNATKGKPYRITHRIITPNQVEKWVEERAEFEFDESGIPIIAIGTVQDVTERVENRKQLENYQNNLEEMIEIRTKELDNARQIAENAAKTKSQFLSNMSHEIRTPLNAIIGYGHLLSQSELGTKQRQQFNNLLTASEHLMELINDILDISKMDANKLVIEQHSINLHEIVMQAFDLVKDRLAKKNLKSFIDLGNVPLFVNGDSTRVKQILGNLLSNAVKFTETGSIRIIGKMEEDSQGIQHVSIAVSDTGIGMTEDHLSRLFEDFHQADQTISRRYGGSGLGLSISRKLANFMGGDITVQSSFGVGSTFTLTIPFQKSEVDKTNLSFISSSIGKVLIIDDEQDTLDILSGIFRQFHVEVKTTTQALEGINWIIEANQTDDPFEIVFVDWKMPDFDGVDTLLFMQSQQLKKHPKFVIITAYYDAIKEEELQEVKVDLVLEKPLTPSRIMDALNDLHTSSKRIQDGKREQRKIFEEEVHILVVDDNKINQDIVTQLLQSAKIKSTIADDGLIAVEFAKVAKYDLVLMDVQMPRLDGISATKLIRKLPNWGQIPILAMTANAMQEEVKECLDAGMNDVITKPINPDVFFDKITRYIIRFNSLRSKPVSSLQHKHGNLKEALIAIRNQEIDRAIGLVSGDIDFYVRILTMFFEDHLQDGKEFVQLLDQNQLKTLSNRAHSLKGSSGNVGFSYVFQLAGNIEKMAKEEKPQRDILVQIKHLDVELHALHQMIQTILSQFDYQEGAPNQEIDTIPWEEIQNRVAVNDIEAIEVVERYRDAILFRYPKVGKQFIDALQNFDFSVAFTLLNSLTK